MNLKNKKTGKGFALVVVLWIVVLLSVITAAMIKDALLSDRIIASNIDRAKCSLAVHGAAETAIAVLLDDDNENSDTLLDNWATNVADFNDITIGNCLVTIKLTDENSKLNINRVTSEQLMQIDNMDMNIVDAILDWRDKDSLQRAGGSEDEYYQQLRVPYVARNAAFRTIKELLFVKGINEELLYGEDVNLNNKLDANEDDGSDSLPIDNADSKLDRGWTTLFSCYSFEKNQDPDTNKRVNIKKASEAVLVKKLKISKTQAKWIKEKVSDKKFKSIMDLIDEQDSKKTVWKQGSQNKKKSQPLDLEKFKSIVDYITVVDDKEIVGKVNINTAGRRVLLALFEGDSEVVDEILNIRDKKENGFTSLAELLDVKGMTVKKFKNVGNYICFRSDIFSLHCTAVSEVTKMKYCCEAVIRRDGTSASILYWYEGIIN